MQTYAEREVFSPHEVDLWRQATALVSRLPASIGGEPLRCHEVARAIGHVLQLDVQDGFYGWVEHSWLWTRKLDMEVVSIRHCLPNVLDVYAPGELPPVQLAHMHIALPAAYRRDAPRTDIQEDVVKELLRCLAN